ncbi:hypothetical protein VXM01_004227 [Escherichia coli]|nr:hypothetical protein [Escherichia coli]
MKQMSLIEMDGFLKGKCFPRDLKVNETNAEYLVRKFAELESKLETALREFRSAGITIDNLEAKCAALSAQLEISVAAERAWERTMMYACGEDGPKSVADKFAAIEAKCAELAAENAELKESEREFDKMCAEEFGPDWVSEFTETPATDAFLAEVRAQGVEMYADNLDNGADDAERGGFDYAVKFLRSEASGVRLFADQLRKGGNQ